MVYLDYAAGNKVEKEVLDTFVYYSNTFYANPNANHFLGQQAKQEIEKYTKRIANLLHRKPSEIIYTSGSSESNNLAIKGICERYKNFGKHILVSNLEHSSILSPLTYLSEKGFEVEIVPVNKDGIVDIDVLKEKIREDTILVSITSMDSELGIVEPIREIGEFLKDYPHCFFHTDASQIIGKEEFDFSNVDLATISSHKIGGLDGISLLIKKENVELIPLIHGGKSTTVYRSGTPILANIAAFSVALEIALKNQKERKKYVEVLQKKILECLNELPNVVVNNTKYSSVYFINFSVINESALTFAKKLDEREVYLSAKTSCCPVSTPSKLVYAVTKDKKLANTSLRVSLSHHVTLEEVELFLKVLKEVLENE